MPSSCRQRWPSVATDSGRGPARRRFLGALPAAALELLAGRARAAPATHQVTIENLKFVPTSLQLRRGERVVWTNKDLFAHTATSAGRFDSGTIAANSSWSYVAEKSGTFDYVCTLHSTMRGTLIVA